MWIMRNKDTYDYFGAKILVQAMMNQDTSHLSTSYNPKFIGPNNLIH
jgi:hypothetical protein